MLIQTGVVPTPQPQRSLFLTVIYPEACSTNVSYPYPRKWQKLMLRERMLTSPIEHERNRYSFNVRTQRSPQEDTVLNWGGGHYWSPRIAVKEQQSTGPQSRNTILGAEECRDGGPRKEREAGGGGSSQRGADTRRLNRKMARSSLGSVVAADGVCGQGERGENAPPVRVDAQVLPVDPGQARCQI